MTIYKFVVTSASLKGTVNQEFLSILETYCSHNKADLCVVPLESKYKCKNSWPEEIREYFIDKDIELNSNLTLAGSLNILPTVVNPLSGLDILHGSNSIIVAHPKIEMKVIPTDIEECPKILVSTGSLTSPVYPDTKAGQRARAAHSYSAVVIEVQNDRVFHARHLHYSQGCVYDLDKVYTDMEVKPAEVDALIFGDIHVGSISPDVYKASFLGKDSLIKRLNPANIVFHDLLDQYARNHHHNDDPLMEIAKNAIGRNDILQEMRQVAYFIESVYRSCQSQLVVVESNHNEALYRWIKEADWKQDPINSAFYLETALALVQGARENAFVSPVGYWLNKLVPESIPYYMLRRDESYKIHDIQIGHHGDKGANGARGSLRQFARTGAKFVIGHSHQPGILDGCYQVGTSTHLKLGYNSGLSGWLNTHCIIYPNATRTLINIIGGNFTC